MEFRYQKLQQDFSALKSAFEALGQQLSEAAKNTTTQGLIPSDLVAQSVLSARTQFEGVRTAVQALAKEMLVASIPGTDELKTLSSIDLLLQSATAAENNKFAIDTEREHTLELMDRVLAIKHRETDDFKPLSDCLAKARELRQAIEAVKWPARHAESQNLLTNKHVFSHLLTLVSQGHDLDDETWARLEESVTTEFGRPLGVAVSRSKLVGPAAVPAKPVPTPQSVVVPKTEAKPEAPPPEAKPAAKAEAKADTTKVEAAKAEAKPEPAKPEEAKPAEPAKAVATAVAEAPKAEPAKAEPVKAEAAPAEAVKAEVPKVEAPKAETVKEAAKAEAPKAEAVKTETAKPEAPKAEPAKPEAHKPEAPKVEPIKTEAPKVEVKPEVHKEPAKTVAAVAEAPKVDVKPEPAKAAPAAVAEAPKVEMGKPTATAVAEPPKPEPAKPVEAAKTEVKAEPKPVEPAKVEEKVAAVKVVAVETPKQPEAEPVKAVAKDSTQPVPVETVHAAVATAAPPPDATRIVEPAPKPAASTAPRLATPPAPAPAPAAEKHEPAAAVAQKPGAPGQPKPDDKQQDGGRPQRWGFWRGSR